MGETEQFLQQLAEGIIYSGGTARFTQPRARAMADQVLAKLYEIGPFAYPSLLDEEGLRFVYQWDENPPVITIMLWNDVLWQDMARIPVPAEINDAVNQ
ncbi:MAG: hypothetical protein K0R39_1302 [Symbiobacteriaceae bacterium]|nr:hypothetical protein [Symbiobacteriaceae bacterium]